MKRTERWAVKNSPWGDFQVDTETGVVTRPAWPGIPPGTVRIGPDHTKHAGHQRDREARRP